MSHLGDFPAAREKLELLAQATGMSGNVLAAMASLECKPREFHHHRGNEFSDTGVFLLLSGSLGEQHIYRSGQRLFRNVHCGPEFVGVDTFLTGGVAHSFVPLGQASGLQLEPFGLRALLTQELAVGLALAHEALVAVARLRQWMKIIGIRSALARVSLALHIIARQTTNEERPRQFDLTLTQEQLGDCCALTAIHINRMLRRLDDSRLIVRKGRLIEVPDWAALLHAA